MSAEIEKVKAALEQSTRLLRMALPVMDEFAMLTAKMHRAQFNAYVAEGFTTDQALYLIKTGASK